MRALILALALLAACHDDPPPIYPSTAPLDLSQMSLGPGDKLEIVIFSGARDMHSTYTLDSVGELAVQHIGAVAAANKTAKQIQDEIQKRLADGYLVNPIVSVNVVEINSRTLSVFGQVARSGTVKFSPGMNITDTIAQSGGFAPLARKNMVKVTRTLEGKKEIYKIPVELIAEGARPNFQMMPGDEVFVPERPW